MKYCIVLAAAWLSLCCGPQAAAEDQPLDSSSPANSSFAIKVEIDDTLTLEYESVFARVYIINSSDSTLGYRSFENVIYHLFSADGTSLNGCGLLSLPHTNYYGPPRYVAAGDTAAKIRKELSAEFGPGPNPVNCSGIPVGEYTYYATGFPSDTVHFRVIAPTSDVDINAHRLIKAALEAGSFPGGSSPWRSDDKAYGVYLDSALSQYSDSKYLPTILYLLLTRTYTIGLSSRQRTEYALELMRIGKPNYALSASMFLRTDTLSNAESEWVRKKIHELRQKIGRGDGSYDG